MKILERILHLINDGELPNIINQSLPNHIDSRNNKTVNSIIIDNGHDLIKITGKV